MKTSEDPPRLLEVRQGDPSPSAAWALSLLEGAEPYHVPVGRKQRVRLGLSHVPRRRAPRLLRAALVAVSLFGCGAIARAALGSWPRWIVQAYERLVPSEAPGSSAAAAPGQRARARRPAQPSGSPVPAPASASLAVMPEAPPVALPPVAAAVPRHDPGAAVAPPRRATQPAPSAGEDTAPVLEAMRALRLEHNPRRARVLLARYLDQHPTGTLAEEALAMSIEAAVAAHDPDAAALSARYLRLHPAGPFRALAQQTISAAGARRLLIVPSEERKAMTPQTP